MRRLTTLFPSVFLKEQAEELGMVERDRKLQIPAFVWTFVFGIAAGECRTLAGFRRSLNSTADQPLSPGGFYQRLTPSLAEYLRDLVERFKSLVAMMTLLQIGMLITTQTRALALESRGFSRKDARTYLLEVEDTLLDRALRWTVVAGVAAVLAWKVVL